MNTPGPFIRFFADENEQVTVSCPRCNRQKTLSATPFKNRKEDLKVSCPCGENFKARIEFRRTFRKKVQLPGEFSNPKTGEQGEVLIVDLSLYGIGFSPLNPSAIVTGDVLRLKFTLDDRKRSQISRRVVVRSVTRDHVGCEIAKDQPPDSDLNFYLLR
jgi:hypothetical protein